jgi:hypothetical protein
MNGEVDTVGIFVHLVAIRDLFVNRHSEYGAPIHRRWTSTLLRLVSSEARLFHPNLTLLQIAITSGAMIRGARSWLLSSRLVRIDTCCVYSGVDEFKVLSLLFTSAAFGYYRQVIDPMSPANALRAPSNQARMDLFPPHYNRPYDPEYQPAYAPPLGPPPSDAKPPDYSYTGGEYLGHGFEKDDKKEDDPFSEYEGPSIPRPLHFAEDRG